VVVAELYLIRLREPLEVVEAEAFSAQPEVLATHLQHLHHKEIMVVVLYTPEMLVVAAEEKVLLVLLQAYSLVVLEVLVKFGLPAALLTMQVVVAVVVIQ
jgi:hypothetical protein